MTAIRYLVALALGALGCLVSVWLVFFIAVETGPMGGAVSASPGGPIGADFVLGGFVVACFAAAYFALPADSKRPPTPEGLIKRHGLFHPTVRKPLLRLAGRDD